MLKQKYLLFLIALLLMVNLSSRSVLADGTLLNLDQGQIPNDTGQDNKTKLTIETNKFLDGRSLKVDFAAGDSFGMTRAGVVRDWSMFTSIEFEVFNPSSRIVQLEFVVKHRLSTHYQSQIRYPIMLESGKNPVKIAINDLFNLNGRKPDLSSVRQWYLADVGKASPTLFFGNIRLVDGDASVVNGSQVGIITSLLPMANGYRVQGTIGDQKVDLTIKPFDPPKKTLSDSTEITNHNNTRRTIVTDSARMKRINGIKLPKIVKPVKFDTAEADAILSALEIFPPDHPVNEVISDWPLHPDSDEIIDSVGADKKMRYNPDMAFILVPPDQKKLAVDINLYPTESDKGPFPIPDEMPIEGWPVHYQRGVQHLGMTLNELQEDTRGIGGDRHAVVVDPTRRMLYEFYLAKRVGKGWQAAQASVFDLKTNKMRPEGWTSTDAAGLPVFPTVVRYDELKRGIVDHAMRVTVSKSRQANVYPARHYASRHKNKEYPRMGERIRLKSSFDISPFSQEVKAILRGLKKYGMIVADNGIDWAISVTPDPRIPDLHHELSKIKGANFEVVIAPSI